MSQYSGARWAHLKVSGWTISNDMLGIWDFREYGQRGIQDGIEIAGYRGFGLSSYV